MVVLGIVVMIFILMGAMIYRNYVRTNDLKIYIFGVRLANSIADHINALNAVGNGHETVVNVPGRLWGQRNYSINFYPRENTVFIDAGSFSTGGDLKVSSPLSTSNIVCLLDECTRGCNSSKGHQCLQVNDSRDIRLVKYQGKIFLTPRYNVAQEDNAGDYVLAFHGDDAVSIEKPPAWVRVKDSWNVMYVYRNVPNDTMSLVFSLNNTDPVVRLFVGNIVGDIVSVGSSQNEESPEFSLESFPQAEWRGEAIQGDIDGGSIEFKSGLHACVTPSEAMPDGDWLILSADGRQIQLNREKQVCITYP